MSIEVHPATPDRWSDIVTVAGRRGDDPSWCWCRRFLPAATSESDGPEPAENNRDALRREVGRAPIAPGLLAYLDDQPVGWTRVGPRSGFPRLSGNKRLTGILREDAGAWWVTCFAVDSRQRRAGIGSILLEAAVEFAREHGATAVEGHPVDIAALQADRVSGSAVFTGTVAMFAAAGFTEVARTHPARPMMRLVFPARPSSRG